MAGFTEDTFEQLPITLITGRLPRNDQEILIPSHVSIKAGVRIPTDEPLILTQGRRIMQGRLLTQYDPYMAGEALQSVEKKCYTVVGTYERAGFEEHDSPGYTVITRSDTTHKTGRYSLFLTLESPPMVRTYAERFAASHPFVLNEDVLRFYGVTENHLFNGVMFAVVGMLALKNFRRNKRRYRSVVLSLTLSVVLFVTGSAFGSTLKGIAGLLTVEVDGDISFYAQDMLQEELLWLHGKLKNVDGVTKSTWQVNSFYTCMVEGISDEFAGDQNVTVGGNGTDGFDTKAYSGQDGKVPALVLDTTEHQVFYVGQEAEFTLYAPDGEQTKTVRERFPIGSDFLDGYTHTDHDRDTVCGSGCRYHERVYPDQPVDGSGAVSQFDFRDGCVSLCICPDDLFDRGRQCV